MLGFYAVTFVVSTTSVIFLVKSVSAVQSTPKLSRLAHSIKCTQHKVPGTVSRFPMGLRMRGNATKLIFLLVRWYLFVIRFELTIKPLSGWLLKRKYYDRSLFVMRKKRTSRRTSRKAYPEEVLLMLLIHCHGYKSPSYTLILLLITSLISL